ncbi:protogenin B-like [Saccostrea echinata]|uniref:protogenin B-like n=1 Tax=Saccostrea echinata TaxID=191078 RepID=UPI002A7FBC21|nr:protogenin B-like [Saccostrea echinata]
MACMYLCSLVLYALAEGLTATRGEDLTSTGISLTRPDSYNVVAQKGNPLLLNCTVESNTSTKFTWYKNGQRLQLENQRRIQVINGSLSFKRVLFRRKKNITDEGVYECHVRNNIGSIIAKRVKVKIAGIAKSYSKEPQSQDVPLGGVARFHCEINSTPPPIYMWQKDDRKQIRPGPRHIMLPSGTLQILGVNYDDAGEYRCTATQGELHKLPDQVESLPWKGSNAASLRVTPASGRREVTILASPPRITSVEKGKSVILECLADGNPKPQVTWARKDGKPLRDRHSEAVGDNLKLFDVDVDDSGVYVCSATSAGYPTKSAEAGLEVMTKPVVVTKPSNFKYPETRTSRFSCEFGGYPKPNVKWYFNGQLLKEGGKYSVVKPKNELVVVNPELTDSGYYQCVGENSLGYDTAVARLDIYSVVGAPDLPRNVSAFAIDQNTINVYWNHSRSLTEPILAYTVDIAESNNPNKQIQSIVVNSGTSAKIEGLKPYTNYSIYIRGYINSGPGPKSRVVRVTTHPDKPSRAPVISVASTTPNSINIEWDELPLEDRKGVITSHLIEYMRTSDQRKVTKVVSGTARSYLISGLKPNTLYKIRVMAGTAMGYPDLPSDSQWVEYRTAGHTNASVNDTMPDPPSNILVKKISANSVNVTWQHSMGEEPVTGYTLTVSSLEGTPTGSRTHEITDPSLSWFQVKNLKNKTTYQFSLVANSKHGSSDPIIKEYVTSQDPLEEPPQNLRVVNRTSTAMLLVWTPHPGDQGRGVEYEVGYRPAMFMKDQAYNKVAIVKTSDTSLWISHLKPYTSYQCVVRKIVGGVIGRWSQPTVNLTLEGVPSQPRELQGQVKERRILITWKPPAQPNGNITTYLVMYQILTSQDMSSPWEIKSVNGSLTSATIEQLQNGLYRIKLKACTNAGPGPPTDPMEISKIRTTEPREVAPQEDQKLGIILGISIGVACVIICILIILFRNKCFASPQSHITQPVYLHSNGHVGGRGNGHAVGAGLNEYQLETCTPMLSSLPGENEHSDSKGCGSGNIIVTPNGSRVNGYVPFKNGMKNGHIPNGHMSTFVGYANSGNMEERRGLIAAMLSGSDVSHLSEDATPLDKAPDRDSLLDGIDKSLEDTEESNKSLNDQDGSIQNLPPNTADSQQVCSEVSPQSMDSFTKNTSYRTAAAKTGQREGRSPPHPSLRGVHSKPATSQERVEGGGMVPSHSSKPHKLHQGREHGQMAEEGQNDGRSSPESEIRDLPDSDCYNPSFTNLQSPQVKYKKPTSAQESNLIGQRRDLNRRPPRGVQSYPSDKSHHRCTVDVSV